jgi:uncharacterized membrane-anchored protein
MNLPQNHPQRFDLNNEVHARPSEALEAPLRVSYIALFGPRRDDDLEPVRWLARQYGAPMPEPGTSHYSGHFGQFRLRWERHTEFARYMFIVPGVPKGNPFDEPAVEQIPRDLVMRLPGETIAAAHAVLVKGGETPTSHDEVAQRCFGSNIMIGSSIAGGAGLALTDFRIHADGFTRFWIEDRGMNPFQAGRLVQRLLEIETYRMMALLALPVARELAPFLRQSERELAEITSAIAADTADEPLLLNRLTRLEALIEEEEGAQNRFRGWLAQAATAVALAMALFHLWAAWSIVPTTSLRFVHVGFALALGFLLFPAARRFRHRHTHEVGGRRHGGESKRAKPVGQPLARGHR